MFYVLKTGYTESEECDFVWGVFDFAAILYNAAVKLANRMLKSNEIKNECIKIIVYPSNRLINNYEYTGTGNLYEDWEKNDITTDARNITVLKYKPQEILDSRGKIIIKQIEESSDLERFEMIIKSDHEKITKEGKFSVEEFDDLLRWICLDSGFKERVPGRYYYDKYGEKDYPIGAMVVLKAKFKKLGYIVPNLLKWITYDRQEGILDELEE